MALFDEVFSKSSIYDMIFFNIKTVLIYPTPKELKLNNSQMYDRWDYLAKLKYNAKVFDETDSKTKGYLDIIYQENAIQYPEFSKIIAISYATLYNDNDGNMKKKLIKIVNSDETIIIDDFITVLKKLSGENSKSGQIYSILCGHNIISYDIPFIIKRFLYNRNKLHNKQLPPILKKALSAKPWESGVIDTVNVWKFNGFDYSPLMLIADFLNLKKTTELITSTNLSKYYWNNISIKPEETFEYISLQSAIQTNLVIQIMIELRNC